MNAKAEGPDNVTGGGFLPLEPEWGYKGRTFNLGQSTTSAIFARIAALYGKMVLRRTHFPIRSQTKKRSCISRQTGTMQLRYAKRPNRDVSPSEHLCAIRIILHQDERKKQMS